ncbi:MAG TPA: flagellar protein FlaG, partial [Azospira sp.]|nr:flagellar protein FlaG [Azospira sp.]
AAAAEIPKTARDAQELSAKAVEEAVDKVAQFIAQTTSEINISVDKDSGMRVVKVVDTETKEVLRQIPSEEVVAIAQALDKLQGLFLRDKA